MPETPGNRAHSFSKPKTGKEKEEEMDARPSYCQITSRPLTELELFWTSSECDSLVL